MTDRHALDRIRHAALSAFDVMILTNLTKSGGEFGLYPGGIAEERLPQVMAELGSMADRDLIAVDEARSTTSRIVLKLTDYGRSVCGQLDKMSVQPRVEVQMHGDTPQVIKP